MEQMTFAPNHRSSLTGIGSKIYSLMMLSGLTANFRNRVGKILKSLSCISDGVQDSNQPLKFMSTAC